MHKSLPNLPVLEDSYRILNVTYVMLYRIHRIQRFVILIARVLQPDGQNYASQQQQQQQPQQEVTDLTSCIKKQGNG